MINIESGIGRINYSMINITFCEKIHEEGVNMTLVITNSTDVTNYMDDLKKMLVTNAYPDSTARIYLSIAKNFGKKGKRCRRLGCRLKSSTCVKIK